MASRLANRNIPRAAFEYEKTADGIIQIIDLDEGTSVTNDIRNVLLDIAQEENQPITSFHIIYLDTEGYWSIVNLSERGTVAGFTSLNTKDQEVAVARMRERLAPAKPAV